MRSAAALAMLLLCCACSHQYVPKPESLPAVSVPTFTVTAPIALLNRTPAREAILNIPPYDLPVDYRQYTDVALQLLKTELEKRGALVEPSATKQLALAFSDIALVPRPGMPCTINFTVTTGAGYVRGLEGRGSSWNFEKAIDAALADAVKAVLTHEPVLKYLSAP